MLSDFSDLTKMWPRLMFFVCAAQILLVLEFFSLSATAAGVNIAEINDSTREYFSVSAGIAEPEMNDSTLLFFYSPLQDFCVIGDTGLYAPNNTANGGLCAYIPAKDRVYACPAMNLYVCDVFNTYTIRILRDRLFTLVFYVAIVGQRVSTTLLLE